MKITLNLSTFYSLGDERRFFQGLRDNTAVSGFHGFARQLEVNILLNKLNNDRLRDLVALLWRYQIPLSALASLAEKPRYRWLDNKQGYWYKGMFEK